MREPFAAAIFYMHGEDKDRAFEWLENSFAERAPTLIYLKALPDWDPIREDSLFQDLLRRMNFPD